MGRGSAGLCCKSKCYAFTRMEISFDCSMQTWNEIEIESEANFSMLKIFPHHLPNSSPLQETEFLIIACHRGTLHCPDVPSTLKFGDQDPPPPLLGDASLVTALCALSPREFDRTTVPSISFAPFSGLFHQWEEGVTLGEKFCNQRLAFAGLLAPTTESGQFAIHLKILVSFIWFCNLYPARR